MLSQHDVIETLPEHLRCFVAHQDYDSYTARDHAVWRFVVRQLLSQLEGLAHPTFFRGLRATGISSEVIPRIETINHAMSRLGWRAVVVDGFLPPAIFMEFQAHCVLPIAVDIRSLDHILYTPAPDIIHETVGHAPFIVDVDYAEFLQRFGELGMQAVSSRADYAIYEAVRHHSILMECPTATVREKTEATETLERKLREHRAVSEASMLSRLHWWTVEYGLVGEVGDSLIFGAGLLSSLGESRHCLRDPAVVKKRLTVDAILQDYDITHEQPQLFVTDSCRHLRQVLDAFGRGVCCQRGGAESVRKAIDAGTVNTVKLDSGLEISGVFSAVTTDAVDNIGYLQTEGPSQLAFEGREVTGHGIDYHERGYGTALGKINSMTQCLSQLSVDELALSGIGLGRRVVLNFVSGISVTGVLEHIVRKRNHNVLFSFSACEVKDVTGHSLFLPEWGPYDLAIGESVVSVFGGAGDRARYPIYSRPSEQTTRRPADADDRAQYAWYRELRHCREANPTPATVTALCERIVEHPDLDWLLYFEAMELGGEHGASPALLRQLQSRLSHRLASREPALCQLVEGCGVFKSAD